MRHHCLDSIPEDIQTMLKKYEKNRMDMGMDIHDIRHRHMMHREMMMGDSEEGDDY